jgi:hypothetical protein
MRDKDWEKQQKAVELLSEMIAVNSGPMASFCREIWLNLNDLIASPRTTLSNVSLEFAAALYPPFAQQLAPQTAQMIVTLLGLTCSCHQFVADGASSVLLAIATNSPRARVFTSFVGGAKHKNPIARGKAVQCLSILLGQGPLDEKELGSVIGVLVPLLRDTKAESREAARRTLKTLSTDDRFLSTAQRICAKPQDFAEMKKLLE